MKVLDQPDVASECVVLINRTVANLSARGVRNETVAVFRAAASDVADQLISGYHAMSQMANDTAAGAIFLATIESMCSTALLAYRREVGFMQEAS